MNAVFAVWGLLILLAVVWVLLRLFGLAVYSGAAAGGRAAPGMLGGLGWMLRGLWHLLAGAPEPKKDALQAVRAEYVATLAMLEAAGLDEAELRSAKALAKGRYLKKIHDVMG